MRSKGEVEELGASSSVKKRCTRENGPAAVTIAPERRRGGEDFGGPVWGGGTRQGRGGTRRSLEPTTRQGRWGECQVPPTTVSGDGNLI
jgi:hypothetical protein